MINAVSKLECYLSLINPPGLCDKRADLDNGQEHFPEKKVLWHQLSHHPFKCWSLWALQAPCTTWQKHCQLKKTVWSPWTNQVNNCIAVRVICRLWQGCKGQGSFVFKACTPSYTKVSYLSCQKSELLTASFHHSQKLRLDWNSC